MKLKSWHLYFIATLCFVLTFVSLNLKFDPFYRVNGINNDNRSLIELYLDEEEQNYLIDHGIPVDQFIDYITYDHFRLQNYTYYNKLREAKNYKNLSRLINDVNGIVDRLSVEFGNSMSEQFDILIKNDLVYAFMCSTYFDFNHVNYYQLMRTLYKDKDYSYIALTNSYVSLLEEYGVYRIDRTMKNLVRTYDAYGIDVLLTSTLEPGIKRMYSFDPLTQVIGENTFIGAYQPQDLKMISNINRLHYSMYMQNDAYQALKRMYDDLYEELNEHFIVTKSFISYDMLLAQEDNAGFNEYQLGTVVDLKAPEISQSRFSKTDMYKWLLKNCHRYGFIQRYPKDKEEVTGAKRKYTFRYVGVEHATAIHDAKLALEEYQPQ